MKSVDVSPKPVIPRGDCLCYHLIRFLLVDPVMGKKHRLHSDSIQLQVNNENNTSKTNNPVISKKAS